MVLSVLATLGHSSFVFAAKTEFCTDADWLALAAIAPLGTEIGAPLCPRAPARMAALGFEQHGEQRYVRRADLTAHAAMRLSESAELPGVDAIAIISIDRRNGRLPYIYATLRSLLRELPQPLIVNVFVGDAYPGYLSRTTLVHQLGESFAARVHVIETSSEAATFLGAHHDVAARATYNYARVLRSYTGSQHLLLFEDDVELSSGMTPVLARHLAAAHPPLVSLYNFLCGHLFGADPRDVYGVRLIQYAAGVSPIHFGRTQGVAYAAQLTSALGDYLSLRLGELPYDTMMDRYLIEHELHIGFAQPSMVQHRGRETTGLGVFHESPCFLPSYPQR